MHVLYLGLHAHICSTTHLVHTTHNKLLFSTVGRAWQSATASLDVVEHSLVRMISV